MSASTWKAAVRQGEEQIAALQKKLETIGPDGLAKLQGEIAGIRFMLTTPERLNPDEDQKIGD